MEALLLLSKGLSHSSVSLMGWESKGFPYLLMCSSIKMVRYLPFDAMQQRPPLDMLTAFCTRVLKSGS